MSDGFYRSFEDKFRGSRDVIKKRLSVYSQIIDSLSQCYKNFSAVDLGCGRGEWLELLHEKGLSAKGVDIDRAMLDVCQELKLDVSEGDALNFLELLPKESQVIVSAFHLVEHLPFDELKKLVEESFRVLKRGGILMMETPNPENIQVGTANFYLDPTHQRPIPPQLLSFLPEYYGFERIKTLRLQESKDVQTLDNLTLRNVFVGVSPDYAVIAQKSADEELLKKTGAIFEGDWGVTLETLANSYDLQNRKRIEQAEIQARDAQATARQLHDQLNSVYSSTSWRVTWPLRKTKDLIHFLRNLLKNGARAVLVPTIHIVLARPWLRSRIDAGLMRFPRLRGRLQRIAIGSAHSFDHADQFYGISSDTKNMSPTARRVYADLKKAINQQQKK
ncbi:O-antigen chain-terminating methyltransferase [Desulfosalsimonas propionicica]|uniref:O-antigen chain-terminating methyltransferase n=1 Tax=Desulfosalsimonas propionicica TaxID=332175 RepID=A0A7W0C6A7_9BACT|nr:class I SAM-dependent methyltransferase [Desulfosalsimonas propionicica]MBA2880005.1 O-antigen chain-terminating methyltransferase [Desulfosalsimonas propionicica]